VLRFAIPADFPGDVQANPLAAKLGVTLDHGRIPVGPDLQVVGQPGVFAIGDIAGGVLLAHKASREARETRCCPRNEKNLRGVFSGALWCSSCPWCPLW